MKPRHLAIGVILLGSAGLIWGALQPLRRSAQTSSCESNLKQIGIAMLQYTRDYDEKFPQSHNWSSVLKPYLTSHDSDKEAAFRQKLQCPTSGSFYVYNRNIAGRDYVRINGATTPWIYEVGAGQNQFNVSDDGKLWPAKPVHDAGARRGNHVLFGDGPVRLVVAKPKFAKFALLPAPVRRQP